MESLNQGLGPGYLELSSEQLRELRELKQLEVALLRAREKAVLEFGLKFYGPHPKQDAFHRAGKYKRRALFAGNRTGKSDCGAAEDCSQALGYRPFYKEGDPARTAGIPQRPQKILILTTDWEKVDDIFTNQRGTDTGKLWKFLPRGFVKSTKKNHSGALEMLECENGSLIKFDTVESWKKNPLGSESSKWDVIHVDEPCPQKMYTAHSRGCVDTGGQVYFTLTPLSEPWIYDMFFGDEADVGAVVQGGLPVTREEIYWSITGSIWDNPYLTEDAIRLYLNEIADEEERECRERGIPLQFAGLVYKEFDQALHIARRIPEGWEDYDQPPAGWPVYLQLDPHPQTPVAGLLTTVFPSTRRYTFDEVWHKGTCDYITEIVNQKIGNRKLIRALADPSCFNRDQLTGSCQADDFFASGLFLDRAIKDLDRGITAVKQALKGRFNDGLPSWMFSPKLRTFFREIKRWSWDKDNKPKDKNDHTLECFYRMVLDDPQWVPPQNDNDLPVPEVPITGLTEEERGCSTRQLIKNF